MLSYMVYTINPDYIWRDSVRRGDIVSKHQTPNGFVEIGIKDSGKFEYYAKETVFGQPPRDLEGAVLERFVEGTDFVIQYNKYRAYKPSTNKGGIPEGRKDPPKQGIKDCVFGCDNMNKPQSLLIRTPSGQVVLKNGGRYNLYYNAFPIEEDGHFMYVPVKREGILETIPHVPQRLTKEVVEEFLDFSGQCTDTILFFNSIHAGASADHLHIQQVKYRRNLKDETRLRNGKFAIENSDVIEYKGRIILKDYPINGIVFDSSRRDRVFGDIERFQEEGVPFNWILIRSNCYLIPRDINFEKVLEFNNIPASLEMTGKIVTEDKELFDTLTRSKLVSAFQKMSYKRDNIFPSICQKNYNPCSQCAEKLMGVAGKPCLGCTYASG